MNLPKLMFTLAIGAALLLTAFAAPVRAEPNATLTVKSAVDWFPGSYDSDCTLREAILTATASRVEGNALLSTSEFSACVAVP